MKDVDFED